MEREKTRIRKDEYPYNFFLMLFPDATLDDLPMDFEASVEYAISAFLTPEKADIVHMRFRDKQSLAAIGEAYGISCERVRQIIFEIRHTLYAPDRRQFFTYGVMKLINAMHEFMGEDGELCIDVTPCHDDDSIFGRVPALPPSTLGGINIPIEMLKLSTRASNALFRGGVKCTEDVARLGWAGLMDMRCLGLKTVTEIVNKMIEIGYPPKLFAKQCETK